MATFAVISRGHYHSHYCCRVYCLISLYSLTSLPIELTLCTAAMSYKHWGRSAAERSERGRGTDDALVRFRKRRFRLPMVTHEVALDGNEVRWKPDAIRRLNSYGHSQPLLSHSDALILTRGGYPGPSCIKDCRRDRRRMEASVQRTVDEEGRRLE